MAKRPTEFEAHNAISTLLRFAGDDPSRNGLAETPARVIRAYGEWFRGYNEDPKLYLQKTFSEVEGYQDVVLLQNIPFQSTCEHHMAPIIGKAHIAYLPKGRIVGLSKLVRVLDGYAKRLQVQERLTEEVAGAIEEVLNPEGVAVMIKAEHFCMATRGVCRQGVMTMTQSLRGVFKEGERRAEILAQMQA